ncbi:DUF2716 domain-containing protein [Rhodococcus sp. NBC_00294]|uniref:DUF2716 domain-containing protein n=1 Tax=Rhodococcus sp. NBC_00294 TaxID=2976004 RepID=UPI002E2C98EE|nr:DUF2716 domain-containing protein [Rhodococcus sp. NBC_00294]
MSSTTVPPGWSFLGRSEEAEQWSRFTDKFGELRPGLTSAEWPAIVEPTPSVTFDLNAGTATAAQLTARLDAVNAEAIRCFLDIDEAAELVVLDWQHSGYRLDVAAHATAVDGTWLVPVYPDGDYYTFALPDFSEGTFGHPWERTLCVFGPRLVDTLGATLSSWLPRLRVDGRQQR